MYLEEIARIIRSYIPKDRLPDSNSDTLLLSYALLLRAKGVEITSSDIHDAWAVWINGVNPNHEALVPYDKLAPEVQQQDFVFVTAVRRAAHKLQLQKGSRPAFREILFPLGLPLDADQSRQALDLYKVMVRSSENLVGRRQGVNTFFLTMNGALLTAYGLIVQASGAGALQAGGIAALALAGIVLCLAWRSLIVSFGQLNRGKFRVINTIEKYLQVAIYAAEWEALGRGEDPRIYRSFTSREIWVPNLLAVIHGIVFIIAMLAALHCVPTGVSDIV